MVADYQYMNYIVNAQTTGQAGQQPGTNSPPAPSTTQNNALSVSSGVSPLLLPFGSSINAETLIFLCFAEGDTILISRGWNGVVA